MSTKKDPEQSAERQKDSLTSGAAQVMESYRDFGLLECYL
jgi:hypothetical protein